MTRAVLLLALACDVSDLGTPHRDSYRQHLEACFEKANGERGYDQAVFDRCLHGHAQAAMDGGTDR